MVRCGSWLYIGTYHCGGHLFPKEMLFDIEKAPYEQSNLAEKRAVCDLGRCYLTEWHNEMMESMDYDNDPMRTILLEDGPFHTRGQLAKYAERLEKTGRSWGC